MTISLEKQVAVVTGGSRGIGAATASLPRFGRAEEVAMPILFLASNMSTYMTGEIININGGKVFCG